MEIINRHTAGFESSVDQGMISSDGQSLPYNRVTVGQIFEQNWRESDK